VVDDSMEDRVEEEAGWDDDAKLISAIRSNSGAGGAMIIYLMFAAFKMYVGDCNLVLFSILYEKRSTKVLVDC